LGCKGCTCLNLRTHRQTKEGPDDPSSHSIGLFLKKEEDSNSDNESEMKRIFKKESHLDVDLSLHNLTHLKLFSSSGKK